MQLNKSLRAILKEYKECQMALEPLTFKNTALQIAQGLEYLHANQVVHLDMKSPNVLLWHFPLPQDNRAVRIKQAGNVWIKIADYGISQVSTELTLRVDNAPVGTPGFMAPELFDRAGQVISSEKVDVFAFGMVLFELLSQHSPFDNIQPQSVGYDGEQHSNDPGVLSPQQPLLAEQRAPHQAKVPKAPPLLLHFLDPLLTAQGKREQRTILNCTEKLRSETSQGFQISTLTCVGPKVVVGTTTGGVAIFSSETCDLLNYFVWHKDKVRTLLAMPREVELCICAEIPFNELSADLEDSAKSSSS